jgi:hypothetical protein
MTQLADADQDDMKVVDRWSKEDVAAAVRDWVARHGEPPTTRCWSPYNARAAGQEWKAERFEAAAGEWPHA